MSWTIILHTQRQIDRTWLATNLLWTVEDCTRSCEHRCDWVGLDSLGSAFQQDELEADLLEPCRDWFPTDQTLSILPTPARLHHQLFTQYTPSRSRHCCPLVTRVALRQKLISHHGRTGAPWGMGSRSVTHSQSHYWHTPTQGMRCSSCFDTSVH